MENNILERISEIGILPVVKINDVDDSLKIAKALKDGGIDCIEITYRTSCATDAIKLINENYPEMLIGAGTVANINQAKEAIKAGAKLIITPGINEELTKWCVENDVLIIPGVSSASEIEKALSYNLQYLKFFPAQSSGGAKKIKDLSAPYQNIKFIPTGGINQENMNEYLEIPNVIACGASFLVPEDALFEKKFYKIRDLAKETIEKMLGFKLIHLGINGKNKDDSMEIAKFLCELFNFKLYEKPKSNFAGVGFEIMHEKKYGDNGHIGIYTPYPQRALYQLAKKGIGIRPETVTYNKKTNKINFVYLDKEIAGFAIHLINPDVKMV